ncbi:hypothetical protein [Brevundimonas sp.]|uniref:hypothetical protein n=1 Tax=Brevundimonas sp. TaxID=1871086 RepID=UPI002ABAC786|nr:hypothetical protein [Brevundimonas sp.]MDZ4362610.1 hypothetical protein [Brevundimonas sp.]
MPAWLTRWFGRYPYTEWGFFLEVRAGELPFERNQCLEAHGDNAEVVLRTDERAELHGQMFLLNGAGTNIGQGAFKAMERCRDEAHFAISPKTTAHLKKEAFHRARADLKFAIQRLASDNAKDEPTPLAGVVDVILSRSGVVTVDADWSQLLTTHEIKDARAGDLVALDKAQRGEFDRHVESIAAQAFFALRDLTHQHYHHSRRSDLLTTVSPWTAASDEEWRRQTQYGLTRMAIAVRRSDTAQSFRQALGIIAYADAFQRHFCGWVSPAAGEVEKSSVSFKYDFAALKSSIEASLKVRELKDSNRRARLFFAFGTAVTALSILVPQYRGNNSDLPYWSGIFRDFLAVVVENPIPTLFAAAALGWAVDHAFLNFALNPDWFDRVRASASRLVGGIMAGFRRSGWPARIVQLTALGMLILVVVASGWGAYVGYRALFSLIGSS